MDTALAPVANSPLAPIGPNGQPPVAGQPGVLGRWSALPGKTQFMALAGVAALIAVVAVLAMSSQGSDYRVLFPNLSEKDGGQVIERLAQMNVPYRIADGSSTVMVPSSRVHELRMKLAAAGLPANGGGVGPATGPGFELLDKQTFGQTQGQERMNVQRALQGELTRTIQQISAVQSARVHLALPNQNGFFREQQKPSASIVLNLHPGHTLDRAQLAGIVHLVASSVPEMNRKAVSVIDSTGALLTGEGADSIEGLDSAQLQYRRDIEQGHAKRVLALLEPVVGRDNVRASVTAEIDFAQVMSTAETHAPQCASRAARNRASLARRCPPVCPARPPTSRRLLQRLRSRARPSHCKAQGPAVAATAADASRTPASKSTRPSPSPATPSATSSGCRLRWC